MRPRYILAYLALCPAALLSQGVAPSQGFGNNGLVVVDIPSTPPDLFIYDTDAMPDGGVLLSGQLIQGSESRFMACRYNSNGQPSEGYGVNGRFTSPTSFGSLNGRMAAAAPDGSVVMVGAYSNNNIHRLTFMRVLPDGLVDPMFGDAGLTTIESNMFIMPGDLEIAPDASVYVTGRVGSTAFALHLTADGDLDSSFGDEGLVVIQSPDGHPLSGNSLEISPNGYLVIAGAHYENSIEAGFVTALDLNGDPCVWFGDSGFMAIDRFPLGTEYWVDMDLLENGSLLFSGSASNPGRSIVLLLQADGSPTPGFGTDGLAEVTYPSTVGRSAPKAYKLASGHVLLSGLQNIVGSYNKIYLIRLNPNGAIDASFGTNGTFISTPSQFTIFMQNMGARLTDGRIVVAGYGAHGNENGYGAMAFELEDLATAAEVDPLMQWHPSHVFPNPTTGEFTWSDRGLVPGSRIELRSTDGRLEQSWNVLATSNGSTTLMIGGHVANGAYILGGEGPDTPKATIVLVR